MRPSFFPYMKISLAKYIHTNDNGLSLRIGDSINLYRQEMARI